MGTDGDDVASGQPTLDATEATEPRASRPGDGPPSPGSRIDHYEVIETLGRGAMGLVVAARDTQLGRTVALKLLRGTGSDRADARLLREAQAMAKLRHPNVVAVHGVGRTPGGVYLAMEYVQGTTLTRWLASSPMWTEIVTHFVAAARGLAAAHDAGIVHRDFKPDNVLVSAGGAVLVADFGLAAATHVERAEPTAPSDDAIAADALTRTGAVVGTPRFMSPEQLSGEALDGRSDQFSFGVALYHALAGRYPYDGRTAAQLFAGAAEAGRGPPPPEAPGPRGLWSTVLRCLASDPDARHADMHAVVFALERVARARSRRRRWVTLGGVALAGLGVGVAVVASTSASSCTAAGRELRASWGAEPRGAIVEALTSVPAPFAEDTAVRVVQDLDAYAEAWSEARHRACVAADEERDVARSGEAGDAAPSDTLILARAHCLEQRRARFEATVAVLRAPAPTPEQVGEAAPLVDALPAIAPCESMQFLRADVPPPQDPERIEAVAQIERRIADLRARALAGGAEEARAELGTLLADAKAVGYAPVVIRAHNVAGLVHERTGELGKGLRALREAYVLADAGAALDVAENHWRTGAILARQAHLEDALAALGKASAVYQRIDAVPVQLDADIADVLADQGRYGEALRRLEDALRSTTAASAPHPGREAVVLNRIAAVQAAQQQITEAKRSNARALALTRQAHGDDHPAVVPVLLTAAELELDDHDPQAALTLLDSAQTLVQRAYGEGHPKAIDVARVRVDALIAIPDFDAAQPLLDRVIADYTAALGAEHPNVAAAKVTAGHMLLRLGRYEEAVLVFVAARAIYEAAADVHPDLWRLEANLATTRLALGHYAQAHAAMEAAVAHAEAVFGADHPRKSSMTRVLGQALLAQGQCARGVTALTRALDEAPGESRDAVLRGQITENLAVGYQLVGRKDEAIAGLRDAVALYRQRFEADHDFVRATNGLLAIALASEGGDEPAARAEADAIVKELQAAVADGSIPAEVSSFVATTARIVGAWQGPLSERDRERVRAERDAAAKGGAIEWMLMLGAVLDPQGMCTPDAGAGAAQSG